MGRGPSLLAPPDGRHPDGAREPEPEPEPRGPRTPGVAAPGLAVEVGGVRSRGWLLCAPLPSLPPSFSQEPCCWGVGAVCVALPELLFGHLLLRGVLFTGGGQKTR